MLGPVRGKTVSLLVISDVVRASVTTYGMHGFLFVSSSRRAEVGYFHASLRLSYLMSDTFCSSKS